MVFFTRILVVLLALCSPAVAAAWEGGRLVPTTTPGLYAYQKDFFRVFYRTRGPHAVPAADADGNGVPDFVEDAAKQLWAADRVFCHLLGFRRPIHSPRYPQAAYVHAWILGPEKLKGFRGMAFDAMEKSGKPSGSPKALNIFLSRALDFRNSATPTHEYFHLIQNSMTYIKNSWYYEGLARWSENALGKRALFAEERWNLDAIFRTALARDFLLASSYDAAKHFWNPLSLRCPGQGTIPLEPGDPLLTLTYSNGGKVLRDRQFPGAAVVRRLLERLEARQKAAFAALGYGRWTQENQRNFRNNPYIIEAIKEAVATPGICRP